jgi:hypothetical protein
MKRAITLAMLITAPLYANVGDSWILPIDHLNGSFTTLPGAGYNGTDAVEGVGVNAYRSIWWKMNSQPGMPSTMELFSVDFFVPTSGGLDWQLLETANVGEQEQTYNTVIPWTGLHNINHQELQTGDDGSHRGQWKAAGPGPQAPASPDYNAGAQGTYVWLDKDAALYAQWDFASSWPVARAWSAIRVTQITPEPASVILLLLGIPLLKRPVARARGHE